MVVDTSSMTTTRYTCTSSRLTTYILLRVRTYPRRWSCALDGCLLESPPLPVSSGPLDNGIPAGPTPRPLIAGVRVCTMDMDVPTYTHGWFVTVRTAVGSWDRASPTPPWLVSRPVLPGPAGEDPDTPTYSRAPLVLFPSSMYLYAHPYDRTARFQHASVCIYPHLTKAFLYK